MNTPVQFNYQTRFLTIKVCDISSQWVLAAAFRVHQPSVPQSAPQRFLSSSGFPAQATGNPNYVTRRFSFLQNMSFKGTPRPEGDRG